MKTVLALFASLRLVSSVSAFVDERGNTATQGAETWLRAAQYMLPKPRYANGHLTLGVGPFPPMPSWEHGNNPWLPFGVHHYTLTQAGVHQMQNLNLTDMAQQKIHLGAVFILPMRFKGGSGSPVRPVVIGHPND